jgi:hypothetical protein
MALVRFWAGRIFGTNAGNVFVRLEDGRPDKALKGTLHLNEPGVAVVIFAIAGTFDGSRLSFGGEPETKVEGVSLGQFKATAILQPDGSLKGEWETTIGTAGVFTLYPHDPETLAPGTPSPVHTARQNFGPIQLTRAQIIELATVIQRDFAGGKLVITLIAGTEQSHYLEGFAQLKFSSDRAEVLRLFVRSKDPQGVDQSVTVEFGPYTNFAMAQGASEAWVLGELEKLKREIRRYERHYATKRVGIGVN